MGVGGGGGRSVTGVTRQKRLQGDYTLGGNSGFKTGPKYYNKMIISLSLVVC